MDRQAEEAAEQAIDAILATALPCEVRRRITVRVEANVFAALQRNHLAAWHVMPGPLTTTTLVVLQLGTFHVAWDVSLGEARSISRLLQAGQPIQVSIQTEHAPAHTFTVSAPPPAVLAVLDSAYQRVAAA